MSHVPSEDQHADILTKALAFDRDSPTFLDEFECLTSLS